MSYCRPANDDSDVYVYADINGTWRCGCGTDTATPGAMADHLEQHHRAGNCSQPGCRVPQHAIDALRADQAAIDAGREPTYGTPRREAPMQVTVADRECIDQARQRYLEVERARASTRWWRA